MLYGYGIGGKTLKWINSFLCFRQHTSKWNNIRLGPRFVGCPQGTVLGILLFSLYINDISTDFGLEIRHFADDCVCYHEFKYTVDTVKLQCRRI